MAEPEQDEHMERRVIVETVSASSSRYSGVTIAIIVVIAVALVVWIVVQMR